MQVEDLQREILEAKRLIDRNQMILQLNEQSAALQKQVEAKDAEIAQLKEPVAA